jgi:hypothetical protein
MNNAQSKRVAFCKKYLFMLTPERFYPSGALQLYGRLKRRFLIGALQKDFRSWSLRGPHESGHSRFSAHAGPPPAEAYLERPPRSKAEQRFQGLQQGNARKQRPSRSVPLFGEDHPISLGKVDAEP